MYISLFFLCYINEISMDMLEKQVSEDSNTYLNEEEGIRMEDSRYNHWRDVA